MFSEHVVLTSILLCFTGQRLTDLFLPMSEICIVCCLTFINLFFGSNYYPSPRIDCFSILVGSHGRLFPSNLVLTPNKQI